MPKVITFTANLLAETTYTYSGWSPGKTHRAIAESFQVGGKGINVSKMLSKLGADNLALCFPGGIFGPACERWMEEKSIATLPFREGCVTRSGSVIRGQGQPETTFLGTDSIVSKEAIQQVVESLELYQEPFVLAICGSVQDWDRGRWEPLRWWISKRPETVSLVVDNYGPSLPWFVQQNPELIKINRDELETLFEKDRRSAETSELLALARERFGCRRWVITDGAELIWVMDGDAEPESFAPRQVDCVSPTGCGDVVFATLIDCLYNKTGYALLKAAKLAAEYGSRNAAMPGIAEFEL
ncbi:PfkB family carbohydrate kinase [Pelagicoccus sp. SDUM812003]|uniref:PfkB family carbohydrate kinase n=1 Tax=Pelagicoccus sp. SDUM812003 TaxID=3041267 RepID=UPI00280E9ECA|nr:PfkB family carbohydrate kinase [Pelagicoccus sp. SDUM812003]MDQ8202395.1 PfkB family carbohydrate kinase [Pelagicoccus sp. SDUM812003]